MKKVLIIMLLISLLITGCHKAIPIESGEAESSTVSTETADTTPSSLSPETTSSFQPAQEEAKPEKITESTVPPQITQPQTHGSEEKAESETKETEAVKQQPEADILPATEAPPKTEVQEPQHNDELPSQTVTEPTESETTTSSQPVTEPEPEPTEVNESEETQETEPETEPAAPFEIGTWISFAQSYAQSIGLNLDSAAVDCWDNPITAGAHCIYLERDICSRLDRYNRDEDITDVWIWAVEIGNGCYDLYIGYA